MRWTIRDEPPPIIAINTTPLIDVLLVLLITLIIAMPLMTHAVKLDLQGGPVIERDVVDIEIEFDGAMYWNSKPIADYRELERLCRSAAAQSSQPIVRVHSDRRTKYDSVAKVLSIAQRSGIRGLGMAGNEQYSD